MASDKRTAPRVHSLNFVAEEGLMFRTLDVAPGGMLIEMAFPPPLGSRLDLRVAFGETIVRLPSQVVRHELVGKNRVGVGVRFEDLDATALKAVEEHLALKKAGKV